MREILFRGKSVLSGNWIYGGVVHQTDFYGNPCDKYFIIDGTDTNDYDIGEPEQVDPKSVGQFTGLTDKNGKKIFEGDIVRLGNSRPYEIKFADGSFYMDGTAITICHADKFTVIGNVHDNPELWRDFCIDILRQAVEE